jgi:very-short-patch-repair endonuclease
MSKVLSSTPPSLDPSGPFRGSVAVASGRLTRGLLRGPRYERLFPDVYVPAELEVDLALRARAAGVLVAGRGVVAGYAAAELLGASSGAPDSPVDVLAEGHHRWPGIRVRRECVDKDEIQLIGGTPVTTAGRAAYDLARWAPTLAERVAAVDALAFRRGVTPADVVVLRHRHLGAHGGGDVAEVLALVDPRAESPMESRVRVALVLGGLPPEVQYPVVVRGHRYRLDLAYPHHRVAVEYDGVDHRGQRRARRDLIREAALTGAGWRVLRFDADEVLFRPDRLVATVRTELGL